MGPLGQELTGATKLGPEWNCWHPSVGGTISGSRRTWKPRWGTRADSAEPQRRSTWLEVRERFRYLYCGLEAGCHRTKWTGSNEPRSVGGYRSFRRTLMVEPRVPQRQDELINLGLAATAARALDVVHPAQSLGSERFGTIAFGARSRSAR